MQRTQAQALAQQTNQGLIAIRQWEISYYSSFYYSFGAQSAVIGGFAYQALTQITFPPDEEEFNDTSNAVMQHYTLLQELFWFFSSLCLATSMHVVLTTMFVQIMGPRMSLYGAIGSMAKAADGMRELVDEIFFAFVLMIIFFSMSTLMSFWVLMSLQSAIASSCLFLISSTQWWRYCSRIYNQFKFDRGHNLYNFRESEELSSTGSFSSEIGPTVAPGAPSKKSWFRIWGSGSENGNVIEKAAQPRRRTKRNSAENMKDHKYSGYVALEDVQSNRLSTNRQSSALPSSQSWSRVFMYLSKHGDLFYFRSKSECPSLPINSRAIEVQLYSITSSKLPLSKEGALMETESLQNVEYDNEFAYEILLQRKDQGDGNSKFRTWRFRLDTHDEMVAWSQNLSSFES